VAALRRLFDHPGSLTVNLGTGRGSSVLEVVAAYARASGRDVPYEIKPAARATWPPVMPTRRWPRLLGWQARHDLDRMCADSWRWQSTNPEGYPA
jgi:UDP-glucose 4-epimerase